MSIRIEPKLMRRMVTKLSGPTLRPRLRMVNGLWRVFWEDTRCIGTLFMAEHVHFMTLNTHRGNEARRWAASKNARIVSSLPGWRRSPP